MGNTRSNYKRGEELSESLYAELSPLNFSVLFGSTTLIDKCIPTPVTQSNTGGRLEDSILEKLTRVGGKP